MLTESLACFIIIFHFVSMFVNMVVYLGKFFKAKGDLRIGYR